MRDGKKVRSMTKDLVEAISYGEVLVSRKEWRVTMPNGGPVDRIQRAINSVPASAIFIEETEDDDGQTVLVFELETELEERT